MMCNDANSTHKLIKIVRLWLLLFFFFLREIASNQIQPSFLSIWGPVCFFFNPVTPTVPRALSLDPLFKNRSWQAAYDYEDLPSIDFLTFYRKKMLRNSNTDQVNINCNQWIIKLFSSLFLPAFLKEALWIC